MTLQTTIQNFATKYPEFTISFSQDEKTQIDVYITSEFIQISKNIGAYSWLKEVANDPDFMWKEEFEDFGRMETTRHYVFLDYDYSESSDEYFVLFFDKKTNEIFIRNHENIPTNSINRIIQDYSVIAEGLDKILVDYKKRGMEFIEKTYSWVFPHYLDTDSGKISLGYSAGFSTYHFNHYPDGSGCWEFDSYLNKETVRQFKKVLKYKN